MWGFLCIAICYLVISDEFLTTHEAYANHGEPSVCLSSLGAIGDGKTDDTRAIQRALDRGGKVVGQPGKVYLVYRSLMNLKTALLVRSNTMIDLNGSTLKLANAQNCSLIATEHFLDKMARTEGISIQNGVIDGNSTNQSGDVTSTLGFLPTFYFTNSDRTRITNITIKNAYMYGVYASGNDGFVEGLKITDALGGGIHVDGQRWWFDRIFVHNVKYFEDINTQGNPFIVNITDSQIGRIYCENYGFGVKFQDGCQNVQVDSITAVGGINNWSKGDFLVKIQGKKEKRNRNIKVNRIISREGGKAGLYIIYSDDVSIGDYIGNNNGKSCSTDFKNCADVLIIDSSGIKFHSLNSQNGQYAGLWLHDNSGNVRIENLSIDTENAKYLHPVIHTAGILTVDNLLIIANNWSRQIIYSQTIPEVPEKAGSIIVNHLFADIAMNAFYGDKIPLFTASSMIINNLSFNTYPFSGFVRLDNNATSTYVDNRSVFRDGLKSGAEMSVTPVAASSLDFTKLSATPRDFRSGGGFDIHHPLVPPTGEVVVFYEMKRYVAPYPNNSETEK